MFRYIFNQAWTEAYMIFASRAKVSKSICIRKITYKRTEALQIKATCRAARTATEAPLTHSGLVLPYGVRDIVRYWFFDWRHKVTAWANVAEFLIEPSKTKFKEIRIKMQMNSIKNTLEIVDCDIAVMLFGP